MITLFTTPKPFHDHIEIIQRNAIASWIHLNPKPEILLFGNEPGAAEVAQEFGITHVPDIVRNDFGTPRVDGLFLEARRLATRPYLCYINADIILLNDFISSLEQTARYTSRFLMVGQRWDVPITASLNFEGDWENRLRAEVHNSGSLHPGAGSDYFVFPRNLWGELPPLVIGRPAWDNWMLYHACAIGAALVDATQTVTAIHQNHDYAHHPDGERGVIEGEEAAQNRKLAGRWHIFTLADTTHTLTKDGLRRQISLPRLRQYLVTTPAFYPFLYVPSRLIIKSCDLVMFVLERVKRLFFKSPTGSRE